MINDLGKTMICTYHYEWITLIAARNVFPSSLANNTISNDGCSNGLWWADQLTSNFVALSKPLRYGSSYSSITPSFLTDTLINTYIYGEKTLLKVIYLSKRLEAGAKNVVTLEIFHSPWPALGMSWSKIGWHGGCRGESLLVPIRISHILSLWLN